MSVLIVDDNVTLLRIINRSLRHAGYAVSMAVTLEKARKILHEGHVEALCLDLQLPDGHGLDLLEELRAEVPDLPVIIISGENTPEIRDRAKRLCAIGFLPKPFALSDLHALLKTLHQGPEFGGNGPLGRSGKTSKTSEPCTAEIDITAAHKASDDNGQASRSETHEPVAASRIARAKKAYTLRLVPVDTAARLITGGYVPQVGDLVLARVDKLNQHKRLELANGRRADLFIGDEIVVCYGNRYAPDQFEAETPSDLSPCHLVAGGGIASRYLSRHSKIREATQITPLGVLADADDRPFNLTDYGMKPQSAPAYRPHVTAVVGTSMNAGKTTTAANLILGMTRQGLKVGAAKVTGTGAGGDVWHMIDAGGHMVVDFTNCGTPSTYKLPVEKCESIMETLIAHLSQAGVDAIVIEVADGILQAETRGLVMSETFGRLVDDVIFAAGDALGAAAGVDWLKNQGISVIGVSGALTASPLATRECAALIDVSLLDLPTLNGGKWLPEGAARRQAQAAETATETPAAGQLPRALAEVA